MAFDMLMNNIRSLPQSEYDKVVEYVQFLMYTLQQKDDHPKRQLGIFQNEKFSIADDFDDIPVSFEEYVS